MLEPRLLLLDEPLAGVNRTLGHALMDHIERFARAGRRSSWWSTTWTS